MYYSHIQRDKLINIKTHLIVVFSLLLPFISVEASEYKSYEMPRTQVIPIQDTQSNRQYELYVKLPENYAKDKGNKYPVIYFTDAVFHIELLSGTEFMMEDVILVGISWQKDIDEDLKKEKGPYVSRYRDYSISKLSDPEKQAKYQFGQASNHLDFIRNDVIKTVENNYRTDPANRTYFGYSMGGKFGAYILMAQPDTFKNYILGSPGLEGDIPKLSELGAKHKSLNANVFISHGGLEKQLAKHAEEFITLLTKRNDKSLSLKHVVIDDLHHSPAFPMTGVLSVKWLSSLQKDEDK